MIKPPTLHAYTPDDDKVATFKYAEDALTFLMTRFGQGSMIKIVKNKRKYLVWFVHEGDTIIDAELLYERVEAVYKHVETGGVSPLPDLSINE